MKMNLKKFFIAVMTAMLLRACVVETFRVNGSAMAPAVMGGDVIVVSKLRYGVRVPGSGSVLWNWSQPKIGDVVVLNYVGDPPMAVLRRVVGLPGQAIRVIQGTHHDQVSGKWTARKCEPLSKDKDSFCEGKIGGQPVLLRMAEKDAENGKHAEVKKIPENMFYVLSDDRRDGPDSRHFGPVSLQAVVGKATSIWLPEVRDSKKFTDKKLKQMVEGRDYFSPIL